MSEEYARVAVLLEDIQPQVRGIAEHQIITGQRLDRLETRFDALDMNVGVLTMRFDGFETKFDGFAADTRRRLERIETHLGLNGSRRQHEESSLLPPRHRKRTGKRT